MKRTTKNQPGEKESAVSSVPQQVDRERDHEQLLAPEAVGQLAEDERADARAGDVQRRGPARDVGLSRCPTPAPGSEMRPEIEPTTFTSSPSRIHAVPRPMTIIQ